MRFSVVLGWFSSFVVCASLAGCSCSGTPSGRCGSSADCPTGQLCVDGTCTAVADGGPGVDGGPGMDSGPPPCTSDDACGGGVCLDGACCPTAGQVCGTACCATTETCFANACVVPGDRCTRNEDCGEGQYCEPALGPGAGADGGMPPADGGGVTCVGTATTGRCLTLPPRCEDDPTADPCITTCEYRPPVDTLNAVIQWRWGPTAVAYPNVTDVWSTPAVARLHDTNCDGRVDALDPPSIVFVSGNAAGNCCHCTSASPSRCRNGALRVLDGLTGAELWSLRDGVLAGSAGFAGISVALGDVDGDGVTDIVAVTGEGSLVALDGTGMLIAQSDFQLAERSVGDGFGWGGGLALADMDGDGTVEVAFGRTVARIAGATISRVFTGSGGQGSWTNPNLTTQLSFFANLDADPEFELVAGRTAYDASGTPLWDRTDLSDGFPAVGDFDRDGTPEVALVTGGRLYILDGATGGTELGPVALGGMGSGGPPTVADFDGDGAPEVGVALANYYVMAKPNYTTMTIDVVWQTANHDLSSSVTGSTVFDFEGDGIAEVIYNDECFMWVYDGPTGRVRFAAPTTSFTATESSLVADVDGDGHAEMVMIANGADPSSAGWGCNVSPWNVPDATTGRPAWQPPPGATAHRGITVFRDAENSWVGTRTLWNQHAYSVNNVCDDGDDACTPPSTYGEIPAVPRDNWSVPWLNNFRQNVQGEGIFDAPDAVVSLQVTCDMPPVLRAFVRNIGAALLPAGVVVGFYERGASGDVMLGTGTTTTALFPGQAGIVSLTAPSGTDPTSTFVARIEIDPAMRTFRECREDNNGSDEATGRCLL